MKLNEAKIEFIQSWGNLGSSWGINKVMAQIHALLLISPEGKSTEDVMAELQISRGNANMNLRALLDWGIIAKEHRVGERKEFFVSEKDVWELARVVAKERRRREIEPLLKALNKVQEIDESNTPESKEFKKVTKDLLELSKKMDSALDLLSKSDKNWLVRFFLKR